MKSFSYVKITFPTICSHIILPEYPDLQQPSFILLIIAVTIHQIHAIFRQVVKIVKIQAIHFLITFISVIRVS